MIKLKLFKLGFLYVFDKFLLWWDFGKFAYSIDDYNFWITVHLFNELDSEDPKIIELFEKAVKKFPISKDKTKSIYTEEELENIF